jgi:hypothetical protein
MPNMAKAFPDSFSTRGEAERAIAERDLAGKKKPRRLVGRWHLVDNTAGTVSISQAIQCAIVMAKREGVSLPVSEVAKIAARDFRALVEKRKAKR